MKVDNSTICWVSGAVQGIGLAVCERLLGQGAKVVMVDVCPTARGNDIAAQLTKNSQGTAKFFRADLTDMFQLRLALDKPKEYFGDVATVVFHNAGIVVNDDDLGAVVKMISLNSTSMIVGTQIAADMLKASGKAGVIVNTASMAGLTDVPVTAAYAGSKWAVTGYVFSTTAMRKSHNVRVNCLCPTIVDTPAVGAFFVDTFGKDNPATKKVLTPEQICDAFMMVVGDDNLHAEAVCIMPQKTFLHQKDFKGVFMQGVRKDVSAYTGAKL